MPKRADGYGFRSARSSGNAGAPDMRWLRTTLPWMSMTVTATSTCCLRDPASTRSAMSLAVVSKSMVVCFLPESELGRSVSVLAGEAQLSEVESESILHVSSCWSPCSRRALTLSCAAGRLTEFMHASQPALISTSGGRLASFTRRLVLAIAHLSVLEGRDDLWHLHDQPPGLSLPLTVKA